MIFTYGPLPMTMIFINDDDIYYGNVKQFNAHKIDTALEYIICYSLGWPVQCTHSVYHILHVLRSVKVEVSHRSTLRKYLILVDLCFSKTMNQSSTNATATDMTEVRLFDFALNIHSMSILIRTFSFEAIIILL